MFNDSILYQQAIKKIAATINRDGGNILITGATGLIGTCLTDVLLEANSLYGKCFNLFLLGRNEERLKNRFEESDKVHFLVQSVEEPILVEGLDYIIHAASNADPVSYALYPAETILTNVMGTKNVLEYCKDKKSRLLLSSSFEVYGKLKHDVYVENEYGIIDLNLVRSCYPESKRVAEMLCKSYVDEFGVDCVIARFSSVYGPTMKENDSKAHAQFIRNAIAGENIVLKSKGLQKRTYCYVMDAVSGLLTVLFKGVTGEAYNIANDNSIATIYEVAKMIADSVGTEVIFDYPDEVENKGFSKPQNCILATEKIKSLGWRGNYNLITGINETIKILKKS